MSDGPRPAASGADTGRMAEQLQAQQQRLQHLYALVDRSPAVVVEWSNRPGWPMTYLSRNVSQWGYTVEQLMAGAIDWDELVHPDDLPAMNAEIARNRALGRDEYQQEYRLRCADGRHVWIEDRTTITRGGDGEILTISGILLDITERRLASEQLAEQKALLEQAEGLAGLGSWVFDSADQSVWWSEHLFRNIGRDPALGPAATREDYLDCMHPDDREAVAAFMQSSAAENGVIHAEFRRHPALGEERWFRASLSRQRRPDGSWRSNGTLLDITPLKQAQLVLQRTNAELERRVAERTEELSRANRELEAFTYTVSHDLKAPLRGIAGYSQLLEEEFGSALGEEARGFVVRIRRGVQQMNALINDLLAYSRMERRAGEREPVDLCATVRSVLDEFVADIERTRASVQIEVPPLQVALDREGLTVVMRNLVGNALKFARPGEVPRLCIGASVVAGRCRMWVRDEGVGFDMKHHDRMFGIFQRLPRTDGVPGNGIGLALVAKAAQRMGGRVWADSAPGRGATFHLDLPV